MKIKDEPLDDFEAALADIADVPDWRAVWGSSIEESTAGGSPATGGSLAPGGGPTALAALRERVRTATGWSSEGRLRGRGYAPEGDARAKSDTWRSGGDRGWSSTCSPRTRGWSSTRCIRR
ncbi:hypothetical protein [Kribbella deserti]|uniref:Uncharacterized protein n=1 Tax=Kribbella deserti TaxID=1926257 RepID=A0ABV6QFE3_9ACTN